ncbi:hypothetical protein INT08_08275 [Prosthecochloris sp. N3]|uniref:Uncharacterized protein n=1 Tax=Prosthecochloris ethylica TaxID=2743976 RepID=A0ABR9XT70_9CHLB|nr:MULTISPECIES: hypothetical protein [Prosthecochloris]MEC9486677.1 hypothetical protein [Prosthecochloris sp.]MBF0586959.1 hypothetical protein [Prosthecochloris ethylica]MBF0637164.1 hypothetical protein [Prosthecochloris ethylica]NUK48172.1 hypothetical protein [Prosthecochloris ethylica]RNA64872.1 hypothetical protein CR163_006285 [Prosthecochloris sp. ZM_2]
MDLLDFIPFRNEMQKAYYGLTGNANHTSEHPVFDELKVRRYAKPLSEISNLITEKIDHWLGWNLKNERKAVGGMMLIRAEVFSFALLGTKIDVAFGLSEEKDRNGNPITTVNAKAETNIESKGDLGESRRMIRMMLGALDFEFRKSIIREDNYLFLSLDPKGSTQALQQLFDQSKIQHTEGREKKKPATIEYRKKPSKQTIELKPSSPSSNGSDSKPAAASSNGSSARTSSKPKVSVIKLNKS